MGGTAWALFAGVPFGVFQSASRRVNQLIDPYGTGFALLLVAVVGVDIFTAATQDLALVSSAQVISFVAFGAAGVIHFFLGWTLLSLSQQRIGAANTGVVTAATPLIGSLRAALVLDEALGAVAIVAAALISAGVILIASRSSSGDRWLALPWYALAASLASGTSPLFIRWGLGKACRVRSWARHQPHREHRPRFVADTYRWDPGGCGNRGSMDGLDLVEVNVVATLQQVATPVVVLLAPFIVGSAIERWTWPLIAGMVAIIVGSTLVVWVT